MAVGIWLQERDWSDKSVVGAVHTLGRVPLFFYLTHLWLYRLRLPGVPTPFYLNFWQTVAWWWWGGWGWCSCGCSAAGTKYSRGGTRDSSGTSEVNDERKRV